MTAYALTAGTGLVAGVVIANLLAVIYGTFTYRAAASPLTPAIRPATHPARPTPVDPPAKVEPQTAAPFRLTAPDSKPTSPAQSTIDREGETHGRSCPIRQRRIGRHLPLHRMRIGARPARPRGCRRPVVHQHARRES